MHTHTNTHTNTHTHTHHTAQATKSLLPTLYLLLKHPQPPVCEAAHAAFGAAMRQLGECKAEAARAAAEPLPRQPRTLFTAFWGMGMGAGSGGDGGGSALSRSGQKPALSPAVGAACVDLVGQAAPRYVQRSLQLPWEASHIAGEERAGL
jgi:hypothetical protein